MNLILGIDPGLSGAFGLYDPTDHKVVETIDMPLHEIRGKRVLDLQQASDWLWMQADSIKAAIIEEVNAMPKQGVTSTFNFGRAFGQAEGLLAGFGIPFQYVRPAVWKRVMKLTDDKDSSRRQASQIFPDDAWRWKNKKDHGRAESVLLAMYAAQTQRLFQ